MILRRPYLHNIIHLICELFTNSNRPSALVIPNNDAAEYSSRVTYNVTLQFILAIHHTGKNA